jgi:hypothetical protein
MKKNERVDVYYEILLKLANSFQHMTTYGFLTIIFISACCNNRHEDKNLATT